MGITATGRKVSMYVCTVLEIKDGKITAEREYMDMGHLMQQLGVK
jgi:predicted ester cyclase